MTTDGVFGLAHNLAGTIGKTFIVECEPVDRSEGIGLSAPVRASVDQATGLTRGRSEEIIGRTTAS